jgi:hypothetical protein
MHAFSDRPRWALSDSGTGLPGIAADPSGPLAAAYGDYSRCALSGDSWARFRRRSKKEFDDRPPTQLGRAVHCTEHRTLLALHGPPRSALPTRDDAARTAAIGAQRLPGTSAHAPFATIRSAPVSGAVMDFCACRSGVRCVDRKERGLSGRQAYALRMGLPSADIPASLEV